MTGHHILIVEDETDIAEILRDYLVKEGYRVSILENGQEVIPFVRNQSPALILLDIMLPGMDGKTLLKGIRTFSDVPVIMITARVEEIDRIIGFELGADDYVCKPFSPREVVVRVAAVLRRAVGTGRENRLSFGSVALDRDSRQVTVKGHQVNLTVSEFDILACMLASPGTVFTRARLIETVQGYSFDGYERTIDFHIKNLRKKIAHHLPGRTFIKSDYGVGYKLVE
ncbi:MAG: response regulator transcription factor [Desulfobacterium sp.]|nr:response regulator transcription factor [Desulfobacterium sp.]